MRLKFSGLAVRKDTPMRIVVLHLVFMVSGVMVSGASSAQPESAQPRPVVSAPAVPSIPRQRIVYHINSNDHAVHYNALLNLTNHLHAAGKEHLDIRVVLHGRGVSFLLKPEAGNFPLTGPGQLNAEMRHMIDDLRRDGVQFLVGQQTLNSAGIDYQTDLYGVSKKDLVANGVMELIRLQSWGYIYIKP